MATFNFNSTGRTEPLTISVKRVGDNRERFLSRNGNVIAFDEDSGESIAYVSIITDSAASPKVSTKEFTLTCQRPPDCQEGPSLQSIVEFNANQIKYQFHGVNVTQIERQIISSNGLIVDSVIDTPSSSIVTSNFSGSLGNGVYTLKIRGKNCYSEYTNGIEFTITDGTEALDWWDNYPRFDYDAPSDTYRILLAINRAGTYPYVIKDDSDVVIVSGFYSFSPGQILDFTGYDPGTYHVEVGPLTGTVVIDEAPAECDEGPTLLSVESVSPTQTRFTFHGSNVFSIEWQVRTPADVIEDMGTVDPGGAVVTINHVALSGGTHNLRIRGSSCTSETGVVDNLDFVVAGASLAINNVAVEQQTDGRYKLTINFQGGNPNYTITVRTQSNITLGSFPNTTGSPASVTLPAGTAPQTVKVMVMDVNNNVDEETAVILPAPTMKMSFLQATSFSATPTETPMLNDGSVFFIGSETNYNWDAKITLPNGGLWDYIEKRLRKKVGGVWTEKSISNATSQPQNYSVSPSISSERLFMPRTGNSIVIDGLNVFKTAGEWEFRAIARKGGVGGAIVSQLTRQFTVSAPAGPSGIFLYNRNGSSLGSLVSEIDETGDSFPKPAPHLDFAFNNFGGITFYGFAIYLRQKVGDAFVHRATNNFFFAGPETSIDASEYSMFSDQDVSDPVFAPIFAQEPGTWQVEVQGWNSTFDQVVATRKAIFDFTVNTSVPSGFLNRGIIKKVVGSRTYQQMQGVDFGSEILPSGNVRIYYPATRQSINGARTCYPWVYLNHRRLHPDDLAALKSGSGMDMPNGKHTFSVKYHSNAVANYDDVIDGGAAGGAYQLAGEITSISFGYSAMDDYFTVSIRTS